jgi:hypothetical protein
MLWQKNLLERRMMLKKKTWQENSVNVDAYAKTSVELL